MKNVNKIWNETKDHLYKIDVFGSLAFKENKIQGIIIVKKEVSENLQLMLSKYHTKELSNG